MQHYKKQPPRLTNHGGWYLGFFTIPEGIGRALLK